ncbi:MAG: hypothetical protein AAFW60_08290 [Pseudomonadota bacterium]
MHGISDLASAICILIVVTFIYRDRLAWLNFRELEARHQRYPLLVQIAILAFLLVLLLGHLDVFPEALGGPAAAFKDFTRTIHGIGHTFTAWAGEIPLYLGGTFIEVGIPLVFSACLFFVGFKRIGAFSLSWLSIALFNFADHEQYRNAIDNEPRAQTLLQSLFDRSRPNADVMNEYNWPALMEQRGLSELIPAISDVAWSAAFVSGLLSIAVFGWAIHTGFTANTGRDLTLN